MGRKRAEAVISPIADELTEAERRELLRQGREAIDRIAELNKDEDPDEVYRFVTEVVEEVRREHHEREQRKAAGGGRQ